MARGWESKSVESQIEAAASRKVETARPLPNTAELARQRECESLQLSRIRILHQLETVENPRYAEMLKKALADLECRIRTLKPGS
jgi:uncharacterized membrane protein YgaE (UPF0421/DUF939 family)